MPFWRVLINSVIATMTIFQLPYQENNPLILGYYEQPILSNETISLQNGLYFFGCFIGTQIANDLQNRSSKFIFLLSDSINLIGNFNYFIWNSETSFEWFEDPYPDLNLKIRIDFYVITRFFIAIAIGINYTQAIIYIKQISQKTKKGYLYFLIPLQMQLGITFSYYIFITIQFICVFFTVIRIILLLILEIETPNYYFFVKQDIGATLKKLAQIHDNEKIQQQIIIIFQQGENNQQLLSKQYLKKYLLCTALVIITQLSYFVSKFLSYSVFVGIVVILIFMFFHRKIQRSTQILAGQAIVCLGLALISFTYSPMLTLIGVISFTLGYNIGLGSLIFQIIPILLHEAEIIKCITAQWIINLAQMCLLGIFKNKSANQEDFYLNLEEIFKLYFYLSCFGFIFLIFIYRVYILTKKDRQKVEAQNEDNVDQNTRIELAQNLIY